MFSQEINGYCRSEVDKHIQSLKATYEAKLMEEKLKALESEKRLLDLKNEHSEIENKEKNILNALSVIEKAKKFQEIGRASCRERVLDKLEILLKELNSKFPLLRRDQNFEDLLSELSGLLTSWKENLDKMSSITSPIYSDNDSMRMLLGRMQDHKKTQDPPKEVHIATNRNLQSLQIPPSESGFSFEEALHPTQDLEQIMKAFDFYNE